MADLRKRIEAIHEMFLSEIAYINDMILWESEFRKTILGFPFLSLKVKYEICDLVFINMHEIRLKHEEIFEEMKKRNLKVRKAMDPHYVQKDDNEFCIDKTKYDDEHVLTLEYASIFFKYHGFMYLYTDYVCRLQKAEYELERLCHYSIDFKTGLQNFLKVNNIEYLGTRNFLYRPSTKLARLPLLLKAILKHEENPTSKGYYEELIQRLKISTHNVDKEFSIYSGQFRIYRLSQILKYRESVKNQMALGLFHKKRYLLKEGEVLMKSDLWSNPMLVKLYIFDHCILFCDITRGEFKSQQILLDPIFYNRLIFFDVDLGFNKLGEKYDKYFPLFLLETSENRLRTLFFEDFDTREIYENILRKAIHKVKRKYNKNIRIDKLDFKMEDSLVCACKSSKYIETERNDQFFESSTNDEPTLPEEEEDISEEYNKESKKNLFNLKELKRAVTEYTSNRHIHKEESRYNTQYNNFGLGTEEHEDSEEEISDEENLNSRYSWYKKLCYGHEIFSHIVNYDIEEEDTNLEFLRNQSEMILIATKQGIYRILENDKILIYEGNVKKILYDSQYEILMFQSGSTLNIARYNYKMISIEPISIKNNIGDFFYGTNNKGSYIATRNYGSSKSSLIYLFLVNKVDTTVTIDLSRKLYVGFRVYNIIFSLKKIIIACKDFEIVDMETLKTEEFLELYNPCLPMLFSMIPFSKAKSVFTIDSNTFLTCFDSVGFFVDSVGRIKKTHVVFLWTNIPLDFKIYYNYLIVISKTWVDVYDLKTGNILYSNQIPGLNFVAGTHDLILHDEDNFYKILI